MYGRLYMVELKFKQTFDSKSNSIIIINVLLLLLSFCVIVIFLSAC